MLSLPVDTGNFKLVSIDPGSNNLGIAILEHPVTDDTIFVKSTRSVKLKDNYSTYASIAEVHGSRVARLMHMQDVVSEILNEIRPHAVIVESNYLGKSPQSFATLVECVLIVRAALFKYDPFIPLHTVDPTTVKYSAGMPKVKGTDKEDVRRAVKKLSCLSWEVNIDDLDEHEVDAVAIGHHFFTKVF